MSKKFTSKAVKRTAKKSTKKSTDNKAIHSKRKTNDKKKSNKRNSHNFQKIISSLEKREKSLRKCIKNKCENKTDLNEYQKSLCYHQKCEKEIEKYKQQKKEYQIANRVINKDSQEHYLNYMKHIMYMEEVEISIDNIIHQIKDDCRLDKSVTKMLINFAKLPYTKKKERIDSLKRLEKESIV
jgi:hypothetical protein